VGRAIRDIAYCVDREPTEYVFTFEKCSARGKRRYVRLSVPSIFYGTEPMRPIGDWKEAWEKAKERAAAILKGNRGQGQRNREAPPELESEPATKRRYKDEAHARKVDREHLHHLI
jgi:hypothetical protein